MDQHAAQPSSRAVSKRAGDEPLYQQLVRQLRAEIEEQFHPGDAIATEVELESRFGVSRITVRRAVNELVQLGLLVRRQGSGTFVAQPKVTQDLGVLHSWTDGMRALGLDPHTVDCEMLQVVAPSWVAQALRLDTASTGAVAEPILRVQRLRYASNEPLCLMIDYLRQRFVPGLAEAGLIGESLYETLRERYGLILSSAEDTVSARRATHFEARLLGVVSGDPVLHVRRITYLPDGEPLGAATVVSRADRYEYRVAGRPGP